MKTVTQEEFNKIVENHNHWLKADCTGSENMKANFQEVELNHIVAQKGTYLCCVNFEGAVLRDVDFSLGDFKCCNFHNARLTNVDFYKTNLCGSSFMYADFNNVILERSNLQDVDFSGAKNLLSPIDYLKQHFEFVEEGVIVYKTFGSVYKIPDYWNIEVGSIITENCNTNRTDNFGSGINVGTLNCAKKFRGDIWKLLIRWKWLPGVVVPYNTDEQIRCEKAEIIEKVDKF